MEKLLEGKVILITGGAQGLGLAMARGCARSGAKVIMADINGEKLAESAGALQAEGLRCEGVKLDVTDEQQIREVIAAAAEKHGRLDGLVNNAGITSKVKFLESTAADFDRVINLNLRSVYLCCRAAAEVMAGQGGGAIVNIASVAARNGGGLMSTSLYAASKGGVISLTKGIARELAPYHIRVNAIAPGSIDTPMTTAGRDPAEYEETIRKMPLHRRGRPGALFHPPARRLIFWDDLQMGKIGIQYAPNGKMTLYCYLHISDFLYIPCVPPDTLLQFLLFSHTELCF